MAFERVALLQHVGQEPMPDASSPGADEDKDCVLHMFCKSEPSNLTNMFFAHVLLFGGSTMPHCPDLRCWIPNVVWNLVVIAKCIIIICWQAPTRKGRRNGKAWHVIVTCCYGLPCSSIDFATGSEACGECCNW